MNHSFDNLSPIIYSLKHLSIFVLRRSGDSLYQKNQQKSTPDWRGENARRSPPGAMSDVGFWIAPMLNRLCRFTSVKI